jgi:ABC-type branched-subunit amino acid transport system ATPase component
MSARLGRSSLGLAAVAVGVGISARGVSVRGPRGVVFENVDIDVPPGGMLAVHGPAGSGRTCLLLALAGRMRLATGAVLVGEHRLPGARRRARALLALARADGAAELEGRLRVRELLAERRWIGRGVTAARLTEAFDLVGIDPPTAALVADLPPATATLLAAGLALAEAPAGLVVDAVDRGCPPEERSRVWQALSRLCASGYTVLASGTDPPPLPAGEPVVPLPLPQLSDARLPEPTRHEGAGEEPA